ncbi:MAG: ABC transporter permease [Actinobacteria bacterium]|nr:ABC transporter permease [Actinomycetota bacterium]MBV9253130.1 ABC transporter permease [Actinomycetota bacterium]
MNPLARLLPTNPRGRTAVWSILAFAGLAIYTQLVLPGAAGGGRGTPMGIVFRGLVVGALNALVAAGIVLIYRTHRVINFAQTAVGATGGELTFQLLQLKHAPLWLAFPLGVMLAAAVGLLFELVVVKRFFNSARLTLTVATIAIGDLLQVLSGRLVNHFPFFPRDRSIQAELGLTSLRNLLPFSGWSFKVGGFSLRFGFADVFALEVTVVALLLLAAFFRFTRAGVAVRAMAENSERATLLGISVGKLSSLVWIIAGALGGVGVILTGLVITPGAASGFAPGVLLPALAAAVIARMRSLPIAVSAAVAISIVSAATAFSLRSDVPLIQVGLFVVVAVGLLLQRRSERRSERGAITNWEAVEEQRAVPKELRGISSVRYTRWTVYALALLLLFGYPFVFSTGLQVLGAVIAINAIVGMSLVVLTGWAGQVSLGQFGFASIGAVVAGALSSRVGLPFLVSVPLGAIAAGAIALVVGIPALRIRGLFLAIVTFAFAIAASATLFQDRYFGWLLPQQVKRPQLFFLNFEDDRSMYFLCVAGLVLTVVVVTNLRRSRFGRVLIAARENEANLQSFGVSAVRAKLSAFAVSGLIAGLGGALLAFELRGVSVQSFPPERSVEVFLFVVLGGVTSMGGVALGAIYYALVSYFFPTNFVFQSLRPFLTIFVLWISPGGLVALINRVRDAALRIIAQRRQIIVPSLFADYDPNVLEKQLIPLSEPLDAAGLAALSDDERFAMESELYARGAAFDRRATREEGSALQAAAAATREVGS